jgi:pimeloyl-ACP methyl ester carboxylesterase
MVWVTLAVVLLAAGVVLVTITAALLAYGLIHPDRMTPAKALAILGRMSPGDLELPFADVTFEVVDESRPPAKIDIAGWWMPAREPSGRCVILLHGYSDAKVGAIAWAPLFRDLGWNILAIDHRAHGESEGAAVTGGHFEKHDLSQVIDQVRQQQPDATRRLVLFGVSMGSAIAAHTAAMRDDLDAMIFESWVGDFIFASHAHTNLMGLPGGFVGELSAHFAAWMTGADFRRDRAIVALPKIKCPVLLILGTVDPFADLADTRRVAAEMPNVEMWTPEGIDHVRAMGEAYDEYKERIDRFLASLPLPGGERAGVRGETSGV